jgi:hypothetical protein
MRLYKPSPTFGEPPNRSGRSHGKGCPKLHCHERQGKLGKGMGCEDPEFHFFTLVCFLEVKKWETRPTRNRRVRICVWGTRVSEPQDSVRGLLRKKERRWPLNRVACWRRCERRERRERKDCEFHKRRALHDAWRQTPVDVAGDGTAIMIHGSEGRARSCGGGLGCLCFFTLMGAAVVPRGGRFRLMGR